MDPRSISLFVLLILLSMFFSASETAFTATPMHKVTAALKEKKRGAKELYKLKLKPERMLISILIGNNIVNIFAASLAALIALEIAQSINYNGKLIITLSTIIVTILVLIFGEILPKTAASRHAERMALKIAPFYQFFIILLFPFILILERGMNGISKNEKKHNISESDLEAFIELSWESGIFENNEEQKIKKLINLDDLTAEEIMTPRIKIIALNEEKTLEEAIDLTTECRYSRIPVYSERIDYIDRIVTLKELLRRRKELAANTPLKELDLSNIIKIPCNQPIDNLLETFQKTHKHIALVLDEYGGVGGIVTLEDILEEVFWEIQDETDEEIIPIKPSHFSDGFICQGHVRIDEILSELDLEIDEVEIEEEYEAERISYFITSHLERFPKTWEIISLPIHLHEDIEQQQHKMIHFKVLWVKKNVIGEVEVWVDEKGKATKEKATK